jgi:catechol 2,3-dioxygenase-like lactoylglutathione lyase family enzyme
MDLNQVTMSVGDLATAEDFYTRLGLRPIVRDDRYCRFECPDGCSTFSIEQVEGGRSSGGITVYFETDDLDGLYARLANATVVFDQPPTDMPWLWREARLCDPDGHQLCLYHAGGNRKNPPWRLSQQSRKSDAGSSVSPGGCRSRRPPDTKDFL